MYEISYIYDEAVNYKCLEIFPIRVKDSLEFYCYADCLQIDKNSIPDIKAITMPYLDYLISISDNEKNFYIIKMYKLLKMCLHMDENDTITFKEKNNKIYFVIKDIFYDSTDFDNIRKIIAEQNLLELPNEKIRKSTRDELDKLLKVQAQARSNDTMCDFEEQMIRLSIETGFSLDDIKNMTIRKYKKYLSGLSIIKNYDTYKPAMTILSGFVEIKDKTFPPHWLSSSDEDDKYSSLFVSEEEVKNKIN